MMYLNGQKLFLVYLEFGVLEGIKGLGDLVKASVPTNHGMFY